jgi:hypothetical protein
MLFSTSSYQKYIIVEPLLLNKTDVTKLLNGYDINNHSQSFKNEIYDIYLVARIKNIGNKGAWGILVCNIEGREVKIHVTGLPGNMDKYLDFFIPVDIVPLRPMDKALTIEVKWEKLYSK